MARPENRSEARPLSLTLPEETFNYLALLATLGKLGRTENEVATHILVREAHALHQRGFHEQRIPAPDQTYAQASGQTASRDGRSGGPPLRDAP